MNLGRKIRKYRLLKGLTQLELGEKLGFSPRRADTRIAKYEGNLMSPKSDIRNKIAEELDVDISALSDNDYSSDVEIMRALFTMQEKYGVSLNKSEDGVSLTFNSDDSKNDLILTYLYAWCEAVDKYKDNEIEYEKWKGRFPKDIYSFWSKIENDISQFYDPLISD